MQQIPLETRHKEIISVDGLEFKDLNNNGKLDPYEDWRLTPEERAQDLVQQMNLDEKVGMMLINSLLSGKGHPEWASEDGVLTAEIEDAPIFKHIPDTKKLINDYHMRHFIARDLLPISDQVEWVNALQAQAEASRLGIPVIIASNSRNEVNGDTYIDGDPAADSWSLYPGTLGISAAQKGDLSKGADYELIENFADNSRQEWWHAGLRKGYMYMIDTVTDPRWQRIQQTFGEDPLFISEITGRLIDGFQGQSLNEWGIALTMKHFPGGGARENGFDPHYKEGKWNIYRTASSLEDYHLPAFKVAAQHNVSSMMPYYSAPSIEKSHYQTYEGDVIPFEEVGFAFNEYLLNDILRDKMGFTGYINSDTGIVDNMDWGVESLSKPAKFAKAINAGTNIIAGNTDVASLKAAVEKGYVPMQRIDQSNQVLLEEMFKLGIFDSHTYVDEQAARDFVNNNTNRQEAAYQAHLKSVTLLKDQQVLPVKGQKVYIEAFHKEADKADKYTDKARKAGQALDFDLSYDYSQADVAVLFLRPVSGDYFTSTPGLLELEICENKENIALNGDSYRETTITNLDRYFAIADKVHQNGGKVITVINITLPWILGNVEAVSDVLIAGYDTWEKAILEVVKGDFTAQGKLPLTLPKNAKVIGVDEDFKCISRNDVPGYAKDNYLREGMSYAYQDSQDNVYELNFGL